MTEENSERDINYHKSQKIGNYFGTLLSSIGVLAGGALVWASSLNPSYFGDYNSHTNIIGFAGFCSLLSSAVGLVKCVADIDYHGKKIKELEGLTQQN